MKKQRETLDPIVESKSAFAKRAGISAPRVTQFIERGLPLSAEGKVPVVEALRWMREHVHAKGGRPLGSPNGGGGLEDADYESAKIRLTLAQAEKAELEVLKIRGELIPRDQVIRGTRTFGTVIKQAWLNAADRHGPALALELRVAPRDLIPRLDAMIRKVMIETADNPYPRDLPHSKECPCQTLKI